MYFPYQNHFSLQNEKILCNYYTFLLLFENLCVTMRPALEKEQPVTQHERSGGENYE